MLPDLVIVILSLKEKESDSYNVKNKDIKTINLNKARMMKSSTATLITTPLGREGFSSSTRLVADDTIVGLF